MSRLGVLGSARWSFFWKAILTDHSLDAAHADEQSELSEFLSDYLSGGGAIEEELADDLAHRFLGATVVGFRSGFQAPKCGGAAGFEVGEQLIVPLSAVAEFAGDGDHVAAFALALKEHGQLACDFIFDLDRQLPGLADQNRLRIMELDHSYPPFRVRRCKKDR